MIESGFSRKTVAVELGRKSLDDMRWEEIWDTALRIRSAFLASDRSRVDRERRFEAG